MGVLTVKKKILCLILIGVMLLSLTACGGGGKTDTNSNQQPAEPGSEEKQEQTAESAPEYTLQLGCAYTLNEDTPRAISTKMIKEKLEARSNGKIKVELYPDSQLGGDREMLESCQAGNIAMVSQTTAPQVAFIPNLAIFDLPHLFDDLDNAYKVLSGPIKEEIAKEYEKAGFKLLLMAPIDFRVMSSNKPIKTMADFKGIKIRTMENPVHLASFRAMGANPSPMPFGELFTALEQNTIDGQENPLTTIYLQKYYEVQKYCTLTNHFYSPFVTMMSKKFWDGLSPEDQALMKKAALEAGAYERQVNRQMMKEMADNLRQAGMTVTELTPEQAEAFRKKTEGVAAQFEDQIGKDIIEAVKAEIAKNE